MGQPKLLLPFGDSTILEQTVDHFLASVVSEVIVVLGDRADAMARRLGRRPVRVARNPAYRRGMSTSIAIGLGMIGPESGAVMLALADQPLVGSDTINHLVSVFNSNNKSIAVPVYRGHRGHPVIFSLKYREALLGLEGDVGGREIVARHPDDVLEVAVDCAGVATDIDNMAQYRAAREQCEVDRRL